jgi:hypothetical protein
MRYQMVVMVSSFYFLSFYLYRIIFPWKYSFFNRPCILATMSFTVSEILRDLRIFTVLSVSGNLMHKADLPSTGIKATGPRKWQGKPISVKHMEKVWKIAKKVLRSNDPYRRGNNFWGHPPYKDPKIFFLSHNVVGIKRRRILRSFQKYKLTFLTICSFKKLFQKTR